MRDQPNYKKHLLDFLNDLVLRNPLLVDQREPSELHIQEKQELFAEKFGGLES